MTNTVITTTIVPAGTSTTTVTGPGATSGALGRLKLAISSAGSNFEQKLIELSQSSSDSNLGTMTTAAIDAQMEQAVFELASGAGKSLTDAMKGVSRKLG